MEEELEDQLLREVDQHEKDFNDMFKYHNEVEEMFHGSDLKQIKEMKDISDVRMKDHITNYNQLQKDMMALADEALDAMNSGSND